MKCSLALFLVAAKATARLHNGAPPPRSPLEHEALLKMEEVCQDDVERHCGAQPKKSSVPSQNVFQDPLMQWMMAPPERLAPPPMFHPAAMEPMDPVNLGPLLDHMMDTALRLPSFITTMHVKEPLFFLEIVDSPQQQEQPAPEEFALDSMVSRLIKQSSDFHNKMQEAALAAASEPTEKVHDLTQHIRLKGRHVLEADDVPEERRRLARRLTEVTPEEMMGHWQQHQDHPWHSYSDEHHEHHHICPGKHKCLLEAREQNKLQPACAGALTRLDKVHEAEHQKMQEMEVYMCFFWFYCVLFLSLFTMIMMRRCKSGRGLFWLRLRVLQAVYSSPEIKKKVEDELQAEIGHVPPLQAMGLRMLSADGREECRRKRLRFCRMLYVIMACFALDAFGLLPEWWPLFVMGGCCVYMVVRMTNLCCSKPEVRECKCCCCGGSTMDVENGTISDAQACCKCCKGTGVCAVKCQTCCGTAGKKTGTGSCCGGKCNCAKDHNCSGGCGCCGCCGDSKHTVTGKTCSLKACEPELKDCKCCCCGVSTSDVAVGLVTDVQACCKCCKGSGLCSVKCHTCCGTGGKKRGTNGAGSCCGGKCNCAKEHNCDGGCGCCGDSKHTRKVVLGPNTVVYRGVPVQIV